MTGHFETPNGPDLTQGVDFAELERDGKLVGRVGEEEVLLVLREDEVFAIGAHCSHYHAPLVDGLVLGGEIHCPWHHASFHLATGEVRRAPALDVIKEATGEDKVAGRSNVGTARCLCAANARRKPAPPPRWRPRKPL